LIVFIIPKNSGLKCKAEEIVKEYKYEKLVEVRGEDVPLVVKRLIDRNKNVIGITGEDLFKEFLLNNKNSNIKIIERIKWDDNNYLFKKPVLCLLGQKNKELVDLPKEIKICINSKYKELAKKLCTNLLENKGYIIEKIYASGTTEEFFINSIVDLVIDVVCTGKSAEKYDLKIYDKLFESDIVVVGNENKFELEDLYKIICQKIKSEEKNSYTLELANDINLLKRKIIEETGEVVTADSKENLIWEFSDLFYFLLVFMAINNITPNEINEENERRNKETLINQDNLNKLKENK